MKTGDIIKIWPRISRACGESYDTEPGAQPWDAVYMGATTDGDLIIDCSGDMKHIRIMPPEFLHPCK